MLKGFYMDGECKEFGVAVLGMHRSGTSAVTGSLRELGLNLGRVLDNPMKINRKGLQEAPAILYMQEDLLRSNGGAWDNPPPKVVWGNLHKSVRDLFIESRDGVPAWGFKDPRTLLTFDGWLEAVPDLKAVGVFRHPHEVAASLQARNGFDLSKGYWLWNEYNERLLSYCSQRDIPIMEFTDDARELLRSVRVLSEHLGLSKQEDLSFIDVGLRNQTASSADIPLRSLEIYEALKGLAV